MLNNALEIYQAFLDGIKMTKMNTVMPDKFVRIWNEWALRDWLKTHGLFDERVSLDPITKDKFRNLTRRYFYGPDDGFPWRFSIPDGALEGYGPEVDPADISTTSGSTGGDALPIIAPVTMEKYLRHLSIQFCLDYDTNNSQECSLTGISEWLPSTYSFNGLSSTLNRLYYLKASDERIRHEIINDKIIVDNGRESEPKYILLEYLISPNHMSYDEDTETISYTIDLTQEQLEEVIDSAVRIHLEGVQSQRYQSFLNEEKLRHR